MPWLAIALVVLLVGWFLYRRFFTGAGTLEHVLNEISYDRINGLVLPNADEGEILIDQLLLTSSGLLVLEVKDIQGTVFGGDKLQEWSAMTQKGRFTFANPQPGLFDRIAAVRQIVRDVPVEGRLLFPNGAEFAKGVPDHVCSLEALQQEFGEADKSAARFKIEAFKPHWERLRKQAVS
jgi:hypothetical protein